ncbi:MAG: uroporphyrinogen-III C-methyltransferase [Phycisphaeraceae bacterium]|nr:uroporphyrinogen-III C-methyltransferase [Phycisphaeraceae bacterium]
MTQIFKKSYSQLLNPDQIGRVILVSAGPGDPNLITVAGLNYLQHADIVVYDALSSPKLLDHVQLDCKRIYVGKRGGNHAKTQDEINDIPVTNAKAGKLVIRLKGGDSYLFGRGAEEVSYLADHGIESLVVPGITSGIAAPMMAGIPVTHRKIASTVTFVTGHEDPTKDQASVDYASLAGLIARGGTVCFYMGVGRLGDISSVLQKAGLSAETPVALVQWGTTPQQRSVVTKLDTAVADVQAAGISSPAIIVVGQVAATNEPGLDFFTRRPLFGKTVLITRTRQQASDFASHLGFLGANVIEAPTIDIVAPEAWDSVDAVISRVRDYDWLILTSANSVSAMAQRMAHMKLDARRLAGVQIAAIGSATADALQEQLNIIPDLIPTQFVAESLAAQMIAQHDVSGKKMLLLRADIARPALPKLLAQAGAEITEHVIYQTKLADRLPIEALEALREKRVDWVTFTSSSTATNMVKLLGDEKDLLKHCKLASIGPITSKTMQALTLQIDLEATQSDIPGLVNALVDASAK